MPKRVHFGGGVYLSIILVLVIELDNINPRFPFWQSVAGDAMIMSGFLRHKAMQRVKKTYAMFRGISSSPLTLTSTTLVISTAGRPLHLSKFRVSVRGHFFEFEREEHTFETVAKWGDSEELACHL
jgi:hypothetical protein